MFCHIGQEKVERIFEDKDMQNPFGNDLNDPRNDFDYPSFSSKSPADCFSNSSA
jgi:hypothetical protein